jgi:hypothetical protein
MQIWYLELKVVIIPHYEKFRCAIQVTVTTRNEVHYAK